MQQLRCSEIWGGIKDADLDVCTGGLTASLFSGAAEGGKGGDIYYFSICGEDMLTRVALADVQGHGEPVSRMSQMMYDALASHVNSLDGDGVLADMNREARRHDFRAITTAAVAGFYKRDSNLYFSYAGHPPVLIRRRGNRRWEAVQLPPRPDAANLPLGVMADPVYDQEYTPLASGDRIFMYTDGLVEARDSSGRLFGDERLRAVLAEAAGHELMELKDAVLEAVRRHTGGSLAHDDVTLMALEVR